MSVININDVGKYGMVKDTPGRNLPPEAWTNVRNVHFLNDLAEKLKGHTEVFTGLAVAPHFLLPKVDSLTQNWLAAGLAKLYVHNGSTWTDITRSASDYNASVTEKWTGGSLSGIVILNNPQDNPQFWAGNLGTPAADLTNWPPSGVTTMRAGVIRPFLNQLIAGDITKDSVNYPMMVKWSSIADPGTLPGSWDESDATVLTGEQDLADTPGTVMDMAPMGLKNVVYKEDAVIMMTFVGRTFVYEFDPLSSTFGVFSKHCVAVQGDKVKSHIVFGYDDVVKVEATKIQSIIESRNRRWLYNAIDQDNKSNSFVVSDSKNKETLICFPESGNTWCNLALVHSWVSDTWGVRELPDLAHAAVGVYDPNSTPEVIDDLTTTLIDDWQEIIDAREYDPTSRQLLAASPVTSKLFHIGVTEQFDGVNMTTSIERIGLGYNFSRKGELIRDFETQKLIERIYIQAEGSGNLNVYVGGQETPDGPITWTDAMPYEIGVDQYVIPWFSTRIPAIKIESAENQTWRLTGISVDQRIVGKHW